MTRTDTLTNRNMFLIGRIALDKEHLHLFQLINRLKQLPRTPTLHGCVNDCLYIRPVEETEEELAARVAKTITDWPDWLCFKNGDPKFKVEHINNEFTLFDAPENKLTWKHAAPKPSRWGILGIRSLTVEYLNVKL